MNKIVIPEIISDQPILTDVKSRLYHICRAVSYIEQITKRAADQIEIIKDLRDQEIQRANASLAWHEHPVKKFALVEIAAAPGKSKTAKLPGVLMAFRAGRATVVFDPALMKEVIKDSAKRAALEGSGLLRTKTTYEIDKTALLKRIQEKGPVPECIKAITSVFAAQEDSFTIKFEDVPTFLNFLEEPNPDDFEDKLLIGSDESPQAEGDRRGPAGEIE